jgi:uncharacterized repeat protein (TIGR02543 family)
MLKKRNLIFLSLLILGVLLITSCLPKPPVTEGILKGQIIVPEGSIQTKDLTGQALPDATVNIIDLTTGEIIATTTTDANGYYQVFVPPGGPYLLEAVKDGVKLQQITPPVEVGIEYDLGTADCATTAVALIVQAMLDAGADLADINLADIEADPDFDDVLSSVTSIVEAGGDPTESAVIEQAVEDFLSPPAPTPTPAPTLTYSVTYNGNGSTSGTVPVDSLSPYEYGATVTVLDNTGTLIKVGYTFVGWNTQADGNGVDRVAGSTFVTGASDVTLYAKWTINTYTVTFNKNGGDTEAVPMTKPAAYGDNVGTLPTAPTRTGYNFDSWNINADGTGGGFTATTLVTADITVYAQWTSQLDRYVGKTNASDDVSHGTTADSPWLTIQYALNETPDGATIYVADGTYTEKITFPSTLDTDGGRAIVLKSENGADTTKIREVYNSGGFIVTLDSCPDGTILDGFTITTEETVNKSTGGIYIRYCSPTIQNNTISGNQASNGGGIYMYICSSPTIQNNTISGNTATIYGGGGIYSHYSSPIIQNNTISGNETTDPGQTQGWGGGIYIYYEDASDSPVIQNNTISGNTTARGGGIYSHYSSPIIQDNTISGNTATYIGGGIYIAYSTSSSNIYNNTISGNTVTSGGAGGINIYTCSPNIYNNTISGNTVTSEGGGISIFDGSPDIQDNDISENIASNNGGGIYLRTCSSNIEENTISGNTAIYDGGGIYITSGTSSPTIQDNEISENIASNNGGGIFISDGSPTIGGVNASDTGNFNTICGNTSNQISPDSYPYNDIFPTCYIIGATGPAGGLIFYINPNYVTDGWRYLEAAPSDQSASAPWGCYGVGITGADGTAVGTGEQNTIDIEAECTTAGTAADICANLNLGSYDDWFLPSIDELNLMYTNLRVEGVGGFTDFIYWSSSEHSTIDAWYQDFGGGQYYYPKDGPFRVRAVRAF